MRFESVYILLIAILLQLLLLGPVSAEIHSPNILILNSYHEGFRGSDDIVQGFRRAITEKLPGANIKIEYLDSKNYSGPAYEEYLFQLLTYKYKDHHFDLIFASDDYAYDFIEKNYTSLFSELPVVFCGTNSFDIGRLEGKNQFVGVDERPSFKETVGLIFKLFPATKRIVVIHDSSITGQLNSKTFRSQTADYETQADFIYWVEQPLEELLAKIRDLPENTAVVYFASYVNELSGKAHSSSVALKALSAASPVPLFGGWEFSLNNGIVGGKLINLTEHGLLAGQIATNVLSGEKSGPDSKLFPSPNVYMFDDIELKRFAIPDSILPENSIIINRPPTFYQQYKTPFFATLAVFFGFLVIISFIKIYSSRNRLRQSAQRHRSILQTAMDGIWLTDDQGRFFEVNEAYCRMSGYSMQELLTMSITDVEHHETASDITCQIEKIMAQGEDRFESQHRRKDGTVYDVEVSIQYHSADGGQFVTFLRDITERKQAQLALEQKNQEMEQFVYSVSHDLKSPLVTVKTFVGMLQQDLKSGDQQQINDDLNYIDKAADKIQQLLDALLQYSRIGTVDAPAQTLSAEESVQNCLDSLAGIIQQHEVHVSTSELPQQLHGDPLHFGQIWQNLIENAVKYRQGKVQPHIEIGSKQQGHDVVFYVRDNGMGIEPKHNERIFNLFSQLSANSEGSGLGLALVKKIVSIYQGRIWVESAGEGQGSCFMFTLPGAVVKPDKPR
ncbi:MAG: PAS domain S-box protein [Desulfuromusa sp.]|nr:PAS domain S-box protein [Desulfuromusa sp.]